MPRSRRSAASRRRARAARAANTLPTRSSADRSRRRWSTAILAGIGLLVIISMIITTCGLPGGSLPAF